MLKSYTEMSDFMTKEKWMFTRVYLKLNFCPKENLINLNLINH
jgi:hypothetical protein